MKRRFEVQRNTQGIVIYSEALNLIREFDERGAMGTVNEALVELLGGIVRAVKEYEEIECSIKRTDDVIKILHRKSNEVENSIVQEEGN